MMLGTLAQRPPVAPSRPEWVPEDATVFLDFVNGRYFAGEAPRAIATLLGGGFDAGEISGSGMFFDFAGTNLPTAAGAFLSDLAAGLAAGCTLLFDMEFVNAPFGWIMFVGDAADWGSSSEDIVVAADDNTYDEHTLNVGSALSGTGVHKLAQTFNRNVGGGSYEYARCVDGAAADTQTVGYAASWTVDTLAIGSDGAGGQQLDHVYIRSITLYPALDPVDLPAMTA